jgi:hypothetical protein
VTIKSGGLVSLRSNKLKPGARAEVIVLVEPSEESMSQPMTAADLLKSGLVGIWAERKELVTALNLRVPCVKKPKFGAIRHDFARHQCNDRYTCVGTHLLLHGC